MTLPLQPPAVGAPAASAHEGFWLVKTGPAASEVQSFPSGQKPLQANWNAAVYLGPTVDSARRWIATAAQRLGVPNPTHVPSLGTTLGIVGAELGGFGAGLAGAASTAGDAAAAATDAAAAGTAEGAAAGGAAGGAGSGIGGKLLKGAAIGGAAAAGGSLLDSHTWIRVLEAVGGVLLLVLGLRALVGGDSPTVTLARVASKVI